MPKQVSPNLRTLRGAVNGGAIPVHKAGARHSPFPRSSSLATHTAATVARRSTPFRGPLLVYHHAVFDPPPRPARVAVCTVLGRERTNIRAITRGGTYGRRHAAARGRPVTVAMGSRQGASSRTGDLLARASSRGTSRRVGWMKCR